MPPTYDMDANMATIIWMTSRRQFGVFEARVEVTIPN